MTLDKKNMNFLFVGICHTLLFIYQCWTILIDRFTVKIIFSNFLLIIIQIKDLLHFRGSQIRPKSVSTCSPYRPVFCADSKSGIRCDLRILKWRENDLKVFTTAIFERLVLRLKLMDLIMVNVDSLSLSVPSRQNPVVLNSSLL